MIPTWMATAIIELGLTKEDFDLFFDSFIKRKERKVDYSHRYVPFGDDALAVIAKALCDED